MKPYSDPDFDHSPDRIETGSLKWTRYARRDILPLWVADMDFQAPPAVIKALQERIHHGIFGYTVPRPQDFQAVCHWMQIRHQWTVDPDWIVWLPGLVVGLHAVCRSFAKPREAVLSFVPIYPPFLTAPVLSDRSLIQCPLVREQDHLYRIHPKTLRKTITEQTRVALFCSPHNPTGRVWEQQEIRELAEICMEKNLILCSDEVHSDLILDSRRKHICTASLSPEIADRTVTLMSPSKTFNLPGLNCAFAVIPNAALRSRFRKTIQGIVPHVNALGRTACRAAYTEGMDWLNSLLVYLRVNRDLTLETIRRLPGISAGPVQATYLAWIDCRELGVPDPARFFEEAGVGLSDGREFGSAGFVRLNFACCRPLLQEALRRIEKAVGDL